MTPLLVEFAHLDVLKLAHIDSMRCVYELLDPDDVLDLTPQQLVDLAVADLAVTLGLDSSVRLWVPAGRPGLEDVLIGLWNVAVVRLQVCARDAV